MTSKALLRFFTFKLKWRANASSRIEIRPATDIRLDDKIKQDKMNIDLKKASADVWSSDDRLEADPSSHAAVRAMTSPAPADQYFIALDERCSHMTIAAESGKVKTE